MITKDFLKNALVIAIGIVAGSIGLGLICFIVALVCTLVAELFSRD